MALFTGEEENYVKARRGANAALPLSPIEFVELRAFVDFSCLQMDGRDWY
jgi:hypothetical protein|tara:strand:+ start:302 stop:451 length:150 start_codon:yes stop_codon:yes gene_type:complete